MTFRGSPCPAMAMLAITLSMSAGCGVLTGAGVDEPSFVITQVPAGGLRIDLGSRLNPDARYPTGSRIVHTAGTGTRGRVIRVLSEGLSSAGAPDLSFAADAILFMGRESPDRPWGIYERRFRERGPRLVVGLGRDCIDPAYLPGARLVFACRSADGWTLHTAALDGSGVDRITFGSASAFDPETLPDGRVLFTMWGTGKEGTLSGLYTVNPDGALLEPFAGIHEEPTLKLRSRATVDGRILFLSAGADGSPARVEELEVRYPEETRRELRIDDIDPISVEPFGPGEMLIAGLSRGTGEGSKRGAGVYSVHRGTRAVKNIFDDPEWDEYEAVSVQPADPPRGRPSMVDSSLATGQIVCYDSSRSASPRVPAQPASVTVLSGDEASPVVSLHPDHSFFLEVPADVPLRIRTLDRTGQEIATSDPFWVRPGEVRACFGCHAGHGSAPVNRRVEALAAEPVTVTLRGEVAE